MADSSTKTKSVSIRLPNKVLGQVDAYALAHDLNRSQALLEILRKGLDAGSADPADAKLDAIAAKIDAIAASQDTADAASKLAVAGILDAIKNQPIAVQEAPRELPAADVGGNRKSRFARLREAWRG